MKKSHDWSADEIKKLVRLWDSKSMTEIEAELSLPKSVVSSMAYEIRKVNPKYCASRRVKGFKSGIIKRALSEI